MAGITEASVSAEVSAEGPFGHSLPAGPGSTNERLHKVAISLLPEYFKFCMYMNYSFVTELTESTKWAAFLVDFVVVIVEPIVSCDEVHNC